MKNVYYLLWTDSILRFQKYHPERKDWKIKIFIFNTWINALNAWIVFIWLKFFNVINIPFFEIDIFPGTAVDYFLSFSIEFALPFGIINYILIFHKDRYKGIIKKYTRPNMNYVLVYTTIIAVGALISAILFGVFN